MAELTSKWWKAAKAKETTGKEVSSTLDTYQSTLKSAGAKKDHELYVEAGMCLNAVEEALTKTGKKSTSVPATLKAIEEIRKEIKSARVDLRKEHDICKTKMIFEDIVNDYKKQHDEFEALVGELQAEGKAISALFPQFKAAKDTRDTKRMDKILELIEKRRKLYKTRAHDAWKSHDNVTASVRYATGQTVASYAPGEKVCNKMAQNFATCKLKFGKMEALLEDALEKLNLMKSAKDKDD